MKTDRYYHGTSPGLFEQIVSSGQLGATGKKTYVASDLRSAKWFSTSRLRWHPDKAERKNWLVLELDLSGIEVVPDDDPEAASPEYAGKLFYVLGPMTADRVVRVLRPGQLSTHTGSARRKLTAKRGTAPAGLRGVM